MFTVIKFENEINANDRHEKILNPFRKESKAVGFAIEQAKASPDNIYHFGTIEVWKDDEMSYQFEMNHDKLPAGGVIVEIPHQRPAKVTVTTREMPMYEAGKNFGDLNYGTTFETVEEFMEWAKTYTGHQATTISEYYSTMIVDPEFCHE